ncbi:biopolymer transport protein ExbD [Pedobacter cryoconitis]|uniref:Biopolymer transport protein ExbD n=1 Tax=Pedobacter cryoconitis TaxID=188932 RepID=A0A7W8YWJ1_9SPHI|nr:biopolymer transporter ExbD [Pedobacter cryoconitis]MBB5622952.1 biopolymer transport protein ExbD [Pedobacter cryoconitis]
MAELNNISRNRKSIPKVDLTAMVDLAFLLITFFMLTTSLSKPVAMDIAKPDISDPDATMDYAASRTMTILLGKDNKVAWYMGEDGKSKPNIEGFNEIRRSILDNKVNVALANSNRPDKTLTIIIKPTSGATYKNFVDIMDELSLVKITNAPAIDDNHITDGEKTFMKLNNIL